MAKNAALYLRISQDRNGDELGIDRQRQDCEKLAAERGWNVVQVLADDDRSAFSGKPRPGYDRLLAALEHRDVNAVVAWHPDRLHRSPKELERFIDVVEATRTQVATVTAGELDLSTASGRMVARIVGSVARHESEQKSERLKRQREQAAIAGRPHGGPRAYGYDDTGMVVVKAEAKAIREAARRILAGEPLKAIARDFNRRGLHTASGREWTNQVLRQTMGAPRLAALRVHRDEIVGPAAWPAILTREQHEQIVATFTARTRGGRPPTSLLAGIIRCGKCGANMQQSASRRDYRRYSCREAPGRKGGGCCSIRADHTEEIIVETVLRRLDTPALASAMAAPAESPGAEIAELEARMGELAESFGSGAITHAEWMRARRPLEQSIDRARRELDQTSAVAVLAPYAEPGALRTAWPRLAIDQQRATLGAVIEYVEIAPAEKRASFDPDRISIAWRA
jgi:DNA invertase Pin-like site-specific DNA recombinase